MKFRYGVLAISLLSVFTFGAARHRPAGIPQLQPAPVRMPVIVELFTSEGCSSCPPADALLAKLESEQPVASAEIIALEEHVDYWNNSGWIDPFSSAEMTYRQYLYANKLGNGNAYTPQMVVGGHAEFVGSRAHEAVQRIEQEAAAPRIAVTVAVAKSESSSAKNVMVKVDKLTDASANDTPEVWLAITETGLHSAVKAGENAGEELHHASVVRSLRKIGVASGDGQNSFTSDQKLKMDAKWKLENVRVVAFVQEKKSYRILGAAAIPIQ